MMRAATLHAPSRRTVLAGAVAAAALATGAAVTIRRDRFDGTRMSPTEVLDAVRAGEILLLDIRRPDEWDETGIGEGAHPIDMRRDDFEAELTMLTGGRKNTPVALICARGVRSDRMGARLAEEGFTRIVDVPQGMLGSPAGPGWLELDLPVVRP